MKPFPGTAKERVESRCLSGVSSGFNHLHFAGWFAAGAGFGGHQARLENRTPQQSKIKEFLLTAKGLYESILLQVTQGTQQWASEFHQSISDLEAMTKAKVKSSDPGALVVSISGAEELDGIVKCG